MVSYEIKHKELVSVLKSCDNLSFEDQKEAVLSFIIRKFDLDSTGKVKRVIQRRLQQSFFNNLMRNLNKLPKNKRKYDYFDEFYSVWLNSDLCFKILNNEPSPKKSPKKINTVGRPKTMYSNASSTTQRRKRSFNSVCTDGEIFDIAERKLRLDGKSMEANLLKQIAVSTDASEIADNKNNKKSRQMSAEAALSLIIEGNLTKFTYTLIRKVALEHGHDLYPSYNKVMIAKRSTHPECIQVTESKCEVPLQSLLDHTAARLIKSLKIESDQIPNKKLVLTCKYGFDGTNVNPYKQKFYNSEAKFDSMLCTSLVPLQLSDLNKEIVYWKNPHTSSVRFCRPIKIEYVKETTDKIVDEEAYLRNQIKYLKIVKVEGFSVSFEMMLTMIDGKVCNAINNASSQMCFICKISISEMNDIENMSKKVVDASTLKYGFSILHAYIRFMELVLHISYRLSIKEWRVLKEKRVIMAAKKKEIQHGLRNELGINVDEPTHGSGNTNDGNTARPFFNNIDVVSRVTTGFDNTLLERFKVILAVINANKPINVPAFRDYCMKTAELYLKLYDWYYMPPSMHIILMHGHEIIEYFFVPIGMISEEAQEANHKIVKRFRELYTRKFSRELSNTDMFHRLLQNSDPLISLSRNSIQRIHSDLTDEMRSLLINTDSESYEEQETTIDF